MTPHWTDDLGLSELDPEAPDRAARPDRDARARAFSPGLGVVEPGLARPDLERVLASAPFPVEGVGPPSVSAFSADPRVLLVSMAGAVEEARTGEVIVEHAGEWVLDGRGGASGVVLDAPGARVAVVVVDGEVRVFDLAPLAEAASPVALEGPDLAHWLEVTPVEPWLLERLEPLQESASTYLRAVAAGMLARMWAPSDPATVLASLMDGDPGVPGRIRQWASVLDEEVRRELVVEASSDIGACHELLDEVRSAAIEAEGSSGRQALRALVERREAIASVRWVLAAGRGSVPELDDGLDELDARAHAAWSDRPRPSGLGDERWMAELRAREPEAWWGQS